MTTDRQRISEVDEALKIASKVAHRDRGPSWREWVDNRLDERLLLTGGAEQ